MLRLWHKKENRDAKLLLLTAYMAYRSLHLPFVTSSKDSEKLFHIIAIGRRCRWLLSPCYIEWLCWRSTVEIGEGPIRWVQLGWLWWISCSWRNCSHTWNRRILVRVSRGGCTISRRAWTQSCYQWTSVGPIRWVHPGWLRCIRRRWRTCNHSLSGTNPIRIAIDGCTRYNWAWTQSYWQWRRHKVLLVLMHCPEPSPPAICDATNDDTAYEKQHHHHNWHDNREDGEGAVSASQFFFCFLIPLFVFLPSFFKILSNIFKINWMSNVPEETAYADSSSCMPHEIIHAVVVQKFRWAGSGWPLVCFAVRRKNTQPPSQLQKAFCTPENHAARTDNVSKTTASGAWTRHKSEKTAGSDVRRYCHRFPPIAHGFVMFET